MNFDNENPLPEIDFEEIDYETLKVHAEEMDRWLGYNLEEVEAGVRAETPNLPDREYWTGKPVQTFSTPYLDIYHSLKSAGTTSHDVVVDLGCGYGRVGAVLALKFPGTHFIGIEAIAGRLSEAERVLKQFSKSLSMKLYHRDLRNFRLNEAEVMGKKPTLFFVYDFGSREDFEFMFESLREYARETSITVIARGGRSRDFIQKSEHWLSTVNPPKHFARFSVYSTGNLLHF